MEREPIPFSFRGRKLLICFEKYQNNSRIAITIHENITLPSDGPGPLVPSPWREATLTCNLPRRFLYPCEFLVKTWSENEPIANYIKKLGIFEDTGRRQKTGFSEAEIWRFRDEETQEQENEEAEHPPRLCNMSDVR